MDILSYFFQNPQAMQPTMPQGNSPLQAGSIAGMQAARNSLQSDEDQRRRAMGIALSQFGRNMSKTGYGPGMEGNLAKMNEGLSNAVQAYAQEDARSQQINAALMEQQQEQLRRKQEWDHKLKREKEQDALAREKMHSGNKTIATALKQQHIDQHVSELKSKGIWPEGATPIAEYPSPVQSGIYKRLDGYIKTGQAAEKADHALEKIEKIIKDHPHLWNGYARLVAQHGRENPSFINNTLKGMFKKDLKPLDELEKNISYLQKEGVAGLPGKAQNMLVDKMIQSSTVSSGMEPEAALNVARDARIEAKKNILIGKEGARASKFGWNYVAGAEEQVPEQAKAPIQQNNTVVSPQGVPDFSQMSTEQLLQERQKAMQTGSR